MSRTFLKSTSAAMLFACALFAQTPTFDVASIKQSEPVTPAMVASGKLHVGMKIDAKRVDIGNMSVLQLICKAYDVKPYQVSGPAWLQQSQGLNGQRFDIVANLPEGATKEQVPQMLQALLADRFKLTVHRESKDQSVYAMVRGKGPLKIKDYVPPAAPDGSEPNPAVTGSSSVNINQTKGGAVVSNGAGVQQKMTMSPDGKSMLLEMSGFTMSEFADGLTPLADHPIVDMTGLIGKYEATMEISVQDLMNAARAMGAAVPPAADTGAASDPSGSLFTSVQALGLKLEPRKSPMASIVVDRVEKTPTEN